jgi:type II secretory pathway component PulC
VAAQPEAPAPGTVAPPAVATSGTYSLRLTDTLFWIERATLTEALAEALAGHVRIERSDAGWKLVEIRAGSLADVLGLRAGDVIRTVDTYAVPDADAWLAVVRGLQRRTEFVVAIDRDGRPMQLRYEIRVYPRDAPREVFEQLLAVVRTGVEQDGERIAIDRTILAELAGTWVEEKLSHTQRQDLLDALGMPGVTIVGVADTSVAGVDAALAALGRQAGASEFSVDSTPGAPPPSRRVIRIVEGRVAKRDIDAVIPRLAAHGGEPEVRVEPRDFLPEMPESPDAAAVAAGIVQVDATHFEITDELRERLSKDPTELARSMRVVPAMVDGKVAGFKLYAIRSRGTFSASWLGLKNGDLVTAIDGTSLASVEDALAAYGKLREAKTIVLELERKGRPLSLTYTFE